MLARIQRLFLVCLLALATTWLCCFWSYSAGLAFGGFLAILASYAGIFALEFILLGFINREDSAPTPTLRELLGAWVGETLIAPKVFACWQPFRAGVVPDRLPSVGIPTGQRGVVLVHGFFCNRGFWTPWLQRLEREQRTFVAVSLEPVFGSIDNYVEQLEQAVHRVAASTGLAPLVVCHSMGGLAARAWLKKMKLQSRVHHVVTIGSPHRGTWLARFGNSENGRQMRLGGDWHQRLDDEVLADRHACFTCWYSNCDNIVFPASTATLPGANNRLVRGAAHVQLAFLPEIMDATLELLDTP